MLTVKHIRLSRSEDLYPTPYASYDPAMPTTTEREATPPTVWVQRSTDGMRYPLTGGTVFVMNESGSTVARYDLGASMVPLGLQNAGIVGDDSPASALVGTALGRAA